MKKIFFIVLFLFVLLLILESRSEESALDENDWDVEAFVDDPDCQDLTIMYREKYGATITVDGKALFYNSKIREYKLVSPEGDVRIEKDNITSFRKFKVPVQKDSLGFQELQNDTIR